MSNIIDNVGAPVTAVLGMVVPYGNLDAVTAYITAAITIACGVLTIVKALIRVIDALKKYANGKMDVTQVIEQIDKAKNELKNESEDKSDDVQ